jgi:hypothetical protein
LAEAEREETVKRLIPLRDNLIQRVMTLIPEAMLTGHPTERLPGHVWSKYRVSVVNASDVISLMPAIGIEVTKPFKKIDDLISNLQTANQITLTSVNSKSLTLKGKVGSIQISQCKFLETLKVDDNSTTISIRDCPKLPPQTLPHVEDQGKFLTLRGVACPDVSEFSTEEIVIEDSILMLETFYPSTIRKLHVSKSIAWKASLDLSRFTQLEELVLDNVKNLVAFTNPPKTLRVIEINYCNDLKGVDLNGIESLKTLKLVGMPEGWVLANTDSIKRIGYLHSDSSLDINFKLHTLSDRIDSLSLINTNLRILSPPKRCSVLFVSHCQKLESINFIIGSSLKKLTVENCHNLNIIRATPTDLNELVIRYNFELTKFSMDFCSMHSLKKANVFLNGIKPPLDFNDMAFQEYTSEQIEEEINKNKKRIAQEIEEGYVLDKKSLRELAKHPESVKTLKLDQLALEGKLTIPDLRGFKQLQSLSLKGMILNGLERVPLSLAELILVKSSITSTVFSQLHSEKSKSITTIKLLNCQLPSTLDLSGLENLKYLEIIGCTGLQNIEEFPPSLNILVIRDNPQLNRVNTIGAVGISRLNIFNNGQSFDSEKKSITYEYVDNKDYLKENSDALYLSNIERNGDCTLPDLSGHSGLYSTRFIRMLFNIDKLPKSIINMCLENNYYQHDTVNFKSLTNLSGIELDSSNGLRRIDGFPSCIRAIVCSGSDLSYLSLKGIQKLTKLFIMVTNSEFQIVDCEDDLVVEKILISASAYRSTSVREFLKKYALKGFELRVRGHEAFEECDLDDRIVSLLIEQSTRLFDRFSPCHLSKLKKLSIKDSHFITHLDELPGTLTNIELVNNSLLVLPDLTPELIDNLEGFLFSNCDRIETDQRAYKEGMKRCEYDSNNSNFSATQIHVACRELQQKFILDSIEREDKRFVKRREDDIRLGDLRNIRNRSVNFEKSKNRKEKLLRQQEAFHQFSQDFLSRNTEFRQCNSTTGSNGSVYLQMKTIIVPDSRTRGFVTEVIHSATAQRAPQGCAVMVYDKEGKISRDYYRFNSYNTIRCDLDERSLIFCYRPKDIRRIALASYLGLSPFQDDTLIKLEIFCKSNSDWGMCYSMLELSKGEEFTLISTPTTGVADEFLIYTNEASDLDLIIDYTEQKISIALKPGVQSKVVTLAHRFKIQDHYLLKDISQNVQVVISDQPLLDDALRNEIIAVLETKPELKILLDSTISPQDKLAYLYDICLHFDLENKDITASSYNSLDIILDLIKNMTGVCRHRSEVFMILAHFLGFPVSMFSNKEHCFTEFPTISEGKLVRRGLCLDGAKSLEIEHKNPVINSALTTLRKEFKSQEEQEKEAIASAKLREEIKKDRKVSNKCADSAEQATAVATKDTIQDEAQDEAQAQALPPSKEKTPEEDKTQATDDTAAQRVELNPAESTLQDSPLQTTPILVDPFPSQQILDSILPLFAEDAPHAPLLQLAQNQDPVKVAAKIRSEFQALPKSRWPRQTLYIHDLSDFKRLTRSVQIAEGSRRFISGPLMSLFQKGGLVIINWSQFSDTQKKRVMSILEPKGTLLGLSASPSVKIISLIQNTSLSTSDAFLTRVTPFRLSQSFKLEMPSIPKANQNSEFVNVELYHLHNWHERLLGKPIKDRHGYRFRKQGKLFTTLEQKKNLRISHLPESESLEVFLHRLGIENELYHNAKFIQTPNEFVIERLDSPFESNNENITLQSQAEENSKPGHFCNANTLHECFQSQIVDSQKEEALIPAGWFAIEDQFYITETITRYEWQELVDKSKKYPSRHFTFTLLPGGEIQGIATYTGTEGKKADKSEVVFSNDTDFCVLELRSQYPEAIIVDVNPQMTYAQLIALIDDKRDSTGQATFTYQQQAVLSGLIHGNTIILNGQISSLLYQQLLPYLYTSLSRIHQNGEEIKIRGRLICVFPQECQEEFLYQHIQVQDYQPEEYLSHISLRDKEKAEKIISLFKLASRLSHLDIGQPPIPHLTFRRLTSMLDRLNNEKLSEVHFENPIKGLLHYDYPRYSTNYAFLNVVAKYFFSPAQSRKRLRWSKCRRFMEDNNIRNWDDAKQHLWKLMNFCSGQVLRELFQESLLNSIDIVKGKPLLKSDEIGEKLFSLLRTENSEETEIPLDDIRHKPIEHLNTLLSCHGTRVIFFKGPSGGGKSYALNELRSQLPKGHYFKGRHQYSRWLATKPVEKTKPVVLNLEEINTEEPGALDIFKGLTRDPSLVHLDGKYSTPSPEHVIVGSGNQETYQNRFFHKFLQEYSETILYTLPSDQWLKTNIMMPILNQQNFSQTDSEAIENRLLWAFHNIHRYSAHFKASIRDLRSLAQRFIVILEKNHDLNKSLCDAIWYEFGYQIQDLTKRSSFQQVLGIPSIVENPIRLIRVGHLYIPEAKYCWVEMINQDLDICAHASAQGQSFRRGILIEGPSGVGKSSLYKVILEQRGYRKDHVDPKQGYYEISVDDSENTLRKILEAAILGYKIIIDELDPCVEELLNECLEGQLPDHVKYQALIQEIGGDQANVHPDFFVLASRNPGAPTSPALLSRFHYFIAEAYTNSEYLAILVEAGVPHPETVLKKFIAAQQKNPLLYNARKFFQYVDLKSKESSSSNEQPLADLPTIQNQANYKN